MKRYWQRIAARIDDMALRQRAMLFATISLLVVALAYVALIDPVLVRQKSLIERAKRDQSQLAAVRAQIEGSLKDQETGKEDPEQAALRELEQRIAEVEKALAGKKQSFMIATRLPALLKDLLGQGRPVKLEALRVLPGTQVEAGAELYRHGVEMTLKGAYFDLLQYLAELEKLPSGLLWGSAELQVEQYPEVRLTLQVHTLSTQRSLGL
jgi:MSHA biogenesis protein MshJ